MWRSPLISITIFSSQLHHDRSVSFLPASQTSLHSLLPLRSCSPAPLSFSTSPHSSPFLELLSLSLSLSLTHSVFLLYQGMSTRVTGLRTILGRATQSMLALGNALSEPSSSSTSLSLPLSDTSAVSGLSVFKLPSLATSQSTLESDSSSTHTGAENVSHALSCSPSGRTEQFLVLGGDPSFAMYVLSRTFYSRVPVKSRVNTRDCIWLCVRVVCMCVLCVGTCTFQSSQLISHSLYLLF